MSIIEKAVRRLEGAPGATETGETPATVRSSAPARQSVAREEISSRVHEMDLSTLAAQGYVAPETEKGGTAEEYRLIKRPILMNAFGQRRTAVENSNLIMVTSALPGEGKTFTAMNLAISMSLERDNTVLLVDADVVRPTITRVLGLENEMGLTDLLADPQIDLGDLIINTDIHNLRILPAGGRHGRSTELLASEQMRRVAKELSDRYPDRIVLFDAPPLLATTQASVLAHQLGQVLLVVEQGRTAQHTVKEAVSLLDKERVIGMVLNKSRPLFSSGGYGGYYGYGYYGQS